MRRSEGAGGDGSARELRLPLIERSLEPRVDRGERRARGEERGDANLPQSGRLSRSNSFSLNASAMRSRDGKWMEVFKFHEIACANFCPYPVDPRGFGVTTAYPAAFNH